MNEKYEIVNRDRNTNWNVGATVTRISKFDFYGYAAFTDAHNPGAVICAHITEASGKLETTP